MQQDPVDVTGVTVAPKLAVTDPKSASNPDKVIPPVEPKVQSILDAKLPDGKSVKEKLDADTPVYLFKAAQDHYNAQKEKGEALDDVSKFYLNVSAQAIAQTGVKEDKIKPEQLAGVFNTELIKKNLEELYKDPDFAQWATGQQANSVQKTIEDNPDIAKLVDPYRQEGENYVNALRRMQSDYMTSQEFADGVGTAKDGKALITEGMKTLSSFGLAEKELLGVGNTLAENVRSKYNPDAPKTIIDPETNKPVATEDGYSLAVLPDGTHIALGTDGKPIADKQGNPYVYNADRTAKVDANKAYVQYDAKAQTTFVSYGGIKYMIGADGTGKYDTQGRPLAIDNAGGAPVALGKDGKAAADKAGNKLVFDPNTGKAVTDPDTGNAVVIDPVTKGIVQANGAGKVIVGQNGDPYAVDQKTGKFVQDAQGNYVQISKATVAPGIVPGYVVDKNSTKVVVNPYNGKPMVDPATGMTVILTPKTNSPELVPLDANGAPKLSEDGKNIIYSKTGNTVVANEGKGPDWLVNTDGRYVQNANGNYIGVDKQSGLAAPVDEKGFVRNSDGLAALWDTKANAPMTTPAGDQVMIDRRGNLLKANAQGYTIFEEKSGLPFVLDPKTRETVVNPDTGRSILLDKGGALVEYNADDGYKYLIDPKTKVTVKTAEGNPVVMSDSAGVPYAVTPEGTVVKNATTGNTTVYGLDGQPAKDPVTGNNIEITASGKAHVIDPKTNAPMAEKDPKTGGYQVYNADGSETVNPDSGNKIQMVPGSGIKMEIDTATGKPAEDGKGNILVTGPDNRPLKTPEGNAVVAENKSGVPVAVDAQGKAIADPASGLPQVINTDTGKAVSDPNTGAAVVVDPASGQPVQIDPKTNKPFKDPDTDLNIIANGKTGAQLQGPNGEPVVMAPGLGMPGYADKATNTFTFYDYTTGKAKTHPQTGATIILDPDLGVPAQVMPDKAGNLYMVDGKGKVKTDPKGNALLLDKETGQVVIKDGNGKSVDANTGKKPEKVAMKVIAHMLPLAQLPSLIKYWMDRKADNAAGNQTAGSVPDENGSAYELNDLGNKGATPTGTSPAGDTVPWDYKTTPEDWEALRKAFPDMELEYPDGTTTILTYDDFVQSVKEAQAADPRLQNVQLSDLISIRAYTLSIGPKINEALRNGDLAALKKWEPFIKGIDSGLNQMRDAGFGGTDQLVRYLFADSDWIDANLSFDLGKPFIDKGYMSTSPDSRLGMEYGNVRLRLSTSAAVDISSVSTSPDFQENMVPRGSQWEITDEGIYKNRYIDVPDNYPHAVRLLDDITPDWPGSPASASANPSLKWPSDLSSTRPILPDNSIDVPGAAANASKWTKLGATIGYAFDALDIVGGGAQIVLGGIQIADGIKHNNSYDIASGALNTVSGVLGVSAGIAGIIGGAVLATVGAWLGGAAFVVGAIAGIIDIINSTDDDEKFADKLEEMYGQLGLLQEGWRQKAQDAHRDAATKYMNPDYQA